jgi:fructokinase
MKLGIDLGGSKIEIVALEQGAALDNTNKTDSTNSHFVECYRKRIVTPQGNYDKTIQAIVDLVKEAEVTLKQKGSLGIGIPGAISPQSGLVKNANSVCLIGKPLQQDLEKRLQRRIKINNDANCMVVSEATDGAAKDHDIVFGVILGTGTGAGIAINNQVITGNNMIAGEWGHNPLPWPQTIDVPIIDCYCGLQNCIETYLSGPGLLKRFNYLGGKAESVEDLLQQVQSGNQLAQSAIENYESQLARALASVINILDPDIIVLAGGLSNIQRLYSNVPKLWGKYIFSDYIDTKFVAAIHGDSSGVRGAAWL